MKLKATALLLAMLMVVTALFGCSSGGEESSQQSSSSSAGSSSTSEGESSESEGLTLPLAETEEIHVGVMKRVLHTTSFDEMPFTQMWEEGTNIHVVWNEIPETSWADQINMYFASDDLDDAYVSCYGISDSLALKYAQAGQIIPLNDLLANYAPNISARLEKFPNVKSLSTAPDGNIYALSRYEYEGSDINCFLYINQEWLDALDLEVPTTTDELYDVLVAFKTKDPNGNGIADEIPLSSIGDFSKQDYSFFNLFGMFGLPTDMNGLVIKDGTVTFAPTADGWKDGIKFFNKLFEEGLLDNETFIQGEQQLTAKGSAEDAQLGMLLGWNAFNYVGSNRKETYISIPYPSADGYEAAMYSSGAGCGLNKNAVFITNAAEKPEVVMAWLDWPSSSDELSVQAAYGPIGYNLIEDDTGMLVYETATPEGMTFGEYRHKWSIATCSPTIHDVVEYKDTGFFYGNPNNVEKAEECDKFRDQAVVESMPPAYMEIEDSETIANIQSDIMNQVLQMSARWISGESDVDADWDSYISTLNGIGLEEYVSLYQKAYDNYLANG